MVGEWLQFHGTIIPGCACAIRLVKLFLAPMLAALFTQFPAVIPVQSFEDLHLPLVAHKCKVLANGRTLQASIILEARVSLAGGTRNLGIEAVAGGRRRTWQRLRKMRQRL
eukprot:3914349-Amphidinium_carterae.1